MKRNPPLTCSVLMLSAILQRASQNGHRRYPNAKTRFQSFFMRITDQPLIASRGARLYRSWTQDGDLLGHKHGLLWFSLRGRDKRLSCRFCIVEMALQS